MWPYAQDAAKTLGVAPQALLAQAAVETGWGKKELKTADGNNSFNVFNIKAGSKWTGETMVKDVAEYVHGNMVKSAEKFRVYGSYDEAFADYAKLIGNSSRYAGALNQDAQGFAAGLQQGGFATDPNYANKIMGVVNSNSFRELFKLNTLQGAIG
jgi:flagellar protein FlgJ